MFATLDNAIVRIVLRRLDELPEFPMGSVSRRLPGHLDFVARKR